MKPVSFYGSYRGSLRGLNFYMNANKVGYLISSSRYLVGEIMYLCNAAGCECLPRPLSRV
jgi:hypothetical protein